MNADFSKLTTEELEAKVTALVLGELAADEVEQVREALSHRPELAAWKARLEATLNLVREAVTQPAAPTLADAVSVQFSADRREPLLARLRGAPPSKWYEWWRFREGCGRVWKWFEASLRDTVRRWRPVSGLALSAGFVLLLAVALFAPFQIHSIRATRPTLVASEETGWAAGTLNAEANYPIRFQTGASDRNGLDEMKVKMVRELDGERFDQTIARPGAGASLQEGVGTEFFDSAQAVNGPEPFALAVNSVRRGSGAAVQLERVPGQALSGEGRPVAATPMLRRYAVSPASPGLTSAGEGVAPSSSLVPSVASSSEGESLRLGSVVAGRRGLARSLASEPAAKARGESVDELGRTPAEGTALRYGVSAAPARGRGIEAGKPVEPGQSLASTATTPQASPDSISASRYRVELESRRASPAPTQEAAEGIVSLGVLDAARQPAEPQLGFQVNRLKSKVPAASGEAIVGGLEVVAGHTGFGGGGAGATDWSFGNATVEQPQLGDRPTVGALFKGTDADRVSTASAAGLGGAAGRKTDSYFRESGSADSATTPGQADRAGAESYGFFGTSRLATRKLEDARALPDADFIPLNRTDGLADDAKKLALAKDVRDGVGTNAGVAAETRLQVSAGRPLIEDLARIEQLKEVEVLESRLGELSDKAVREVPAVPPPTPQPEVATVDNPFSTFSLNVTDVSYKLAEASLANGVLPSAGSIRTEEFLNAFDYRDPDPVAGMPLSLTWERARYPFAQQRDVLRLAVRTGASGRENGRALNLVLVLDSSGSMERADRVRIVAEALRTLASQLKAGDRISVVAFARTARLWVDGLPGERAGELPDLVGELVPEGGTNLEDALRVAYETALKHFVPTGGNRVVLLTDGAANLGELNPDSLQQRVEEHRARGVALDCFGIGWDGYNDDLLEVLSRHGDGRYGFVNSPEEAVTGFADRLAGALQVAASDVKVQVEFNPQRVATWRQVGYARHQLAQEQFRDNTVDAAEIGAAESGNALYIIETIPAGDGPVGVARVRYRDPDTAEYRELEWVIPYEGAVVELEQASPGLRLATVAASFGEWLSGSPFAAEVTTDRLIALMNAVPDAFSPDPRPGQLEEMIRQARAIGGR